MRRAMTYKRISDYGIIGDMHSCALVGLDGSIDWCCFPRFDSPSVFAAILDDTKGGRFQIAPSQPYESSQRYLPHTNILETIFTTETGRATVTDFMPLSETGRPGHYPHQIYRIVRCEQGHVDLSCLFDPRFDYARACPRLRSDGYGVVASNESESLTLSATEKFQIGADGARAELSLREGEERALVVSYGHKRPPSVNARETRARLDRTRRFWQAIVDSMRYDGLWKEEVVRSFLALHLLMYRPTGAVVAAPTTSLPEDIGGERNWDYRYCWLRDGAWTLDILFRIGDPQKGHSFMEWLLSQCQRSMGRAQILYGIAPDSEVTEQVLSHLEGYRGSRPVRLGNAAADQFQMDVFGEVILSLATHYKYSGYLHHEMWEMAKSFAEVVSRDWQRPDHGIWEIRGEPQHFIYSKVMCWVALDRAIKLAEAARVPAPTERWRQLAYTIKAQVMEQGWSHSKHAFVQRYGSEAIDASNLVLPFVGFLPTGDPRIRSTVERIMDELVEGPFVQRYIVEETPDGLSGCEGAFTMLTFWLIGALISCGQVRKAHDLFEQMLGHANHLGLFSEMIDPRTGEALGNFPQAFSHIGLIHTARNLSLPIRLAQAETALA